MGKLLAPEETASLAEPVFVALIWITLREESGLKEADGAVRYARAKVKAVFDVFSPKAPDEFRIIDDSGHALARQELSDDLAA